MLGGAFALLLRTELLTPGRTIMDADHLQPACSRCTASSMVFLFMIPAIPDGVRQLRPADDARREGSRVSAAQPRELLRLRRSARRSRCGGMVARRRRHRLDVLRAVRDDARRRDVAPVAIGVFVLGVSSIMTGLNFIVDDAHAARARAALARHAALRLDDLRDEHHPGARDAGARPVGDPGRARSRAAHRHLRSGARRRSGAVPAPVLVLLAPRGLHHDPAGDGRDQRDRADVRAARTRSSYNAHRVSRRSASRSSAS